MKKALYIIILCLLVIVFLIGCSNSHIIPIQQSQEKDPEYKLKESIRQQFRPEWKWNEDTKEYDNIDSNLKRDSETGLFIEPPKNEELEGYATWDGKLGLYVINETQINHKTGEVRLTQTYSKTSISKKPNYRVNTTDLVDKKYSKYLEVMRENINPASSVCHTPGSAIAYGWLDKEFFRFDIKDVPILLEKINQGFDADFTIEAIETTMNIKTDTIVSFGMNENYQKWVDEINQLIDLANKGFDAKETDKLGYLALPYIEDQIRQGKYEEYAAIVSNTAKSFSNNDAKATSLDSKDRALTWFDENKEDIDVIRKLLETKIEVDWLNK